MTYPRPLAPKPAGDQNVLSALILHQHQAAAEKAGEQLKEAQNEMKVVQQEHEGLKKKKELDDKLHEETRKELDKLKMQFDGNHIFEKKTIKRESAQRARLAKGKAKKTVAAKQKEARNAKKTKSGSKSTKSRASNSRASKSN